MQSVGYTLIPDWMLSLELDSRATWALAVIYGHSQDGASAFTGSLPYLAGKIKCSRSTAIRVLDELVTSGYVRKTDVTVKNVKVCEYRINPEILPSIKMTLPVSKWNYPCQNDTDQYQNDTTPADIISEARARVVSSPESIDNNIINNNTQDINILQEKERNSKKESEGSGFPFKRRLMDLGVPADIARDFMLIRKRKQAVNSETAFKRLVREINKSGYSAQYCITICVEKSWKGFEAKWIKDQAQAAIGKVSTFEQNMRAISEMFGQPENNNPEPQYDEQ